MNNGYKQDKLAADIVLHWTLDHIINHGLHVCGGQCLVHPSLPIPLMPE